jgi:alpha-L-fucosidase
MSESPASLPKGETAWFTNERFGMFIHWGIYSLLARHEWVKNYERIPDAQYQKYFNHFDPDLYNPAVWAEEAANAGMKYAVITTKHHDGFCLWDSAQTDYKATNTPARRDLIRPFVDSFRQKDLRIGFYHSLLDWHHPEFPVDGLHPQRDDLEFREKNTQRDVRKYADYLHAQTHELLSQYGKVDVLWFDYSYTHLDWGWAKGKGKGDWQSEKLIKMIRSLQPGVILNDRLEIGGDLVTPEQYQPREWMKVDGKPVLWEACQTLNGSWGYHRDNMDWKSTDMLIKMLVDTVSKGGNFLLNVGPNARGEFEPKAIERLRGIGQWMRLHNRSIYGCGASEFTPPVDCRYTQNGKRLYLHIFSWPFRHIHLEGLGGKVEYAQLLNDASEVKLIEHDPNKKAYLTGMGTTPGAVILDLPIQKPDVTVPVVELFLKD